MVTSSKLIRALVSTSTILSMVEPLSTPDELAGLAPGGRACMINSWTSGEARGVLRGELLSMLHSSPLPDIGSSATDVSQSISDRSLPLRRGGRGGRGGRAALLAWLTLPWFPAPRLAAFCAFLLSCFLVYLGLNLLYILCQILSNQLRLYMICITLRILAMCEAENSKICNFCAFRPLIQLIKCLLAFKKMAY